MQLVSFVTLQLHVAVQEIGEPYLNILCARHINMFEMLLFLVFHTST
jgi:hypothetical protein